MDTRPWQKAAPIRFSRDSTRRGGRVWLHR
jgi:hypothetical protein